MSGDILSSLSALQWLTVAVFAAVWLHNAVQVWIGGDELSRIVAGLRDNVFEGYRRNVAHRLDALARWLRDTHAAGAQAFSGSAFLLCLGAAIYPIVAFVAAWALSGGAGRFGDLQVLPDDVIQSDRLVLLAALAAPAAVAGGLRVLKMADFVLLVGCLIAFIAVGALAYAGAEPAAILVAASFAMGALFAGAPALAGSFVAVFSAVLAAGIAAEAAIDATVTVAIMSGGTAAVLIAALVNMADRWGLGWCLPPILVGVYLMVALALARAGGAGTVAPLDAVRDGTLAAASVAVLFLTVFPAVNAPISWLSIGVTRALTSWFTRAAQGMASRGIAFAGAVIAIDAVIALALSAATVAGLAAAATLVSQVHVASGGAPLFDVAGLVSQMRSDPGNPDWWWIYGMIFATLIPTLIHFLAFARALATIVVIKPLTGTAWVADSLEQGHSRKGVFVIVPSFVLTILQLVPAAGLIALGWVLLSPAPGDAVLSGFGNWLADLAISAARMVTA